MCFTLATHNRLYSILGKHNFWSNIMTAVTIVIPTYKRAEILPHMLSALARQSFKDFDVIMVVKPSGDGTEEILKQASAKLKIQIILQPQGHLVDAYFLGAKNSTGDIVAFLDDDAIPADDWLEETVKVFHDFDVAGVTGDAFPVLLKNGEIQILKEDEIPSVLSRYEFALFGRPLRGLEDYKNSIAASGEVYERGNNVYWRKRGAAKALLRGPSMAINGKILRSISLPSDYVLGCAWEMMLGWQIWKQGHDMLYSPKVKVYHIVHGRTSSRDCLNPRSDLLWAVEAELLFYRLYHDEPQFSLLSKLISDIVRTVHSLKHLKTNVKYYLRKIEGIFFGNIIGAKWVIYKKLNLSYSPLTDLKRFQAK
jgi:glycosyltransferase involved in cell wall biosynthesis